MVVQAGVDNDALVGCFGVVAWAGRCVVVVDYVVPDLLQH